MDRTVLLLRLLKKKVLAILFRDLGKLTVSRIVIPGALSLSLRRLIIIIMVMIMIIIVIIIISLKRFFINNNTLLILKERTLVLYLMKFLYAQCACAI